MRFAYSILVMVAVLLTFACTNKPANEGGEGAVVEPERVYARRCASCHGPGGAGDGPMSPTFAHVSDLTDANVQAAHSDEELRTIITKGYKRMPPVRNLSDPELDALVAHVRTLGGIDLGTPLDDPAIVEEDAP